MCQVNSSVSHKNINKERVKMKVQNLNGTSDNTCKCGSWLQHWKNYSRLSANECVVNNCRNKSEVGGHVQKGDSLDQKWYVIPVCTACNAKRGQDLHIDDKVELVPANVSQTCGLLT